MSDYDDDWSDYDGEEWMYIEDEYMMADDLAEHAVNSPPQTSYLDEDGGEEWDRFAYFNDIEYASDGYDDADFVPHDSEAAKKGLKRKRVGREGRGQKKQRLGDGTAAARPGEPLAVLSPVVWRSQTDREMQPKVVDGPMESYALLKDWRERLKDTPAWASGSSHAASTRSQTVQTGKKRAASTLDPMSLDAGEDAGEGADEEEDEKGEEHGAEIDPAALMAALQSRLAAAGGPLNGMDPQQLLQYAMRMMTEKDAGDEIAGELANNMLEQAGDEDEEEEEGDAPAHLVSWLSKQKAANQEGADGATADPKSPVPAQTNTQPPTPPSSEATRSIRALEDVADPSKIVDKNASAFDQNNGQSPGQGAFSRKRKAVEDVDVGGPATSPKKRAIRSAASQAKAAPSTKTTRSARARS